MLYTQANNRIWYRVVKLKTLSNPPACQNAYHDDWIGLWNCELHTVRKFKVCHGSWCWTLVFEEKIHPPQRQFVWTRPMPRVFWSNFKRQHGFKTRLWPHPALWMCKHLVFNMHQWLEMREMSTVQLYCALSCDWDSCSRSSIQPKHCCSHSTEQSWFLKYIFLSIYRITHRVFKADAWCATHTLLACGLSCATHFAL